MKFRYTLLLISGFLILHGCSRDCGRVDHGTFSATFFNEEKEKLPNLEVAVYVIGSGTFTNHDDKVDELTSLEMIHDYYGAPLAETDENGHLDMDVQEDVTSSCDAPDHTYDNSFESIVVFYECAGGDLKYQEFIRYNNMEFVNKVNEVDSVFIAGDCLP